MVITAAALLLAGLGIVVADSVFFARACGAIYPPSARIIADNSTAALAFNDPDSAAQTLGALRARSHVDAACIYWNNGVAAGQILAPTRILSARRLRPRPSVRTGGDKITLAQPILLHGKRIGTLVLVYDLGEIQERIRLYGTTVACVLLAASLLAFLLSSQLAQADRRAHFAGWCAPPRRFPKRAITASGRRNSRATKWACWWIGSMKCWPAFSRATANLKKALADREAALQEAENERERFRFMAESMPQKIFTASATGESDYLNKQWMDFTGLPFEQIRDWGWAQFIHPDDLEDESARLAAVASKPASPCS